MKVKRSDDLLVALDAMRANEIEAGTEKIAPRKFFRGSEVGNCSNQINFRRRGTPVGEGGVNKSRFLDDGHLHQAVLSAELKKAGIKVLGEEEESIEKVLFKGGFFKIKAHKDGTVVVDGEKQLLEVKSVKEVKFQELMKSDNVEAYYDQIQIYLYLYEMTKCKLVVVDRNNSLRLEYEVLKDPERIKHLLNKLATIEKDLSAGRPSSKDYPRTSRECGWCPYHESCWGTPKSRYAFGDKLEKAVEVDGKEGLKTWNIGIDLYRKYQRLSQEAKGHKEEADQLLEILFLKYKATKIYGEGGSVSKSLSSRSIPDKTVIKELILKGVIPTETIDTLTLRYSLGKGEEVE